jgi:hypothetical protein
MKNITPLNRLEKPRYVWLLCKEVNHRTCREICEYRSELVGVKGNTCEGCTTWKKFPKMYITVARRRRKEPRTDKPRNNVEGKRRRKPKRTRKSCVKKKIEELRLIEKKIQRRRIKRDKGGRRRKDAIVYKG